VRIFRHSVHHRENAKEGEENKEKEKVVGILPSSNVYDTVYSYVKPDGIGPLKFLFGKIMNGTE
jgi:hypothetical protein